MSFYDQDLFEEGGWGYFSNSFGGERKCVSAKSLLTSSNSGNLKFDVISDSEKNPLIKCSRIIKSKGNDQYIHFDMPGQFLSYHGEDFLRLPIVGIDSFCSILSLGLNPKRIGYVKQYRGVGIKIIDDVWQKIADDFLVNLHLYDVSGYCRDWMCNDQSKKDIVNLYTIGEESKSVLKSHATPLIPLKLPFPEEYNGLIRRVALLYSKYGGGFA